MTPRRDAASRDAASRAAAARAAASRAAAARAGADRPVPDPGGGPPARVIPLHADDTGTRPRWRLGGPTSGRPDPGPPPDPFPPGPESADPGDRGGPRAAGSTPGGSTPGGSTPGPSAPGASAPGASAPGASAPGGSSPGGSTPPPWEEALAAALAFVRRRLEGDYAVDDFGFDADLTDNLLLPALRPLYRTWFRVETIGMHHVPAEGGALVVANHSGTLPLDSLMTAVALHDDHPAHRYLRMLAADLMFRLPGIGSLARKHGSTLACTPDAERLMSAGELVGVWPEGFKGIGKPFRDRYKLQRFGRGGFVSAALRTGVPIIPCSIVGAEEIYPKIGDIPALARLFGAPYFPVTPLFPHFGLFGLVPLPSKWYIEFGEPISTDSIGAAEADDPMTVFNLTDQVRETIQHTLYRLLSERRNAFLG